MKRYLLYMGVSLFIIACATNRDIANKEKKNTVEVTTEDDSTEYTLISFDFGFDSWYLRFKYNVDVRSQI